MRRLTRGWRQGCEIGLSCLVSVEFPIRSDTVREHGRGRRGEGDRPVYFGRRELTGESPHYLVLIVCGNRPDKRARAGRAECVNVEGAHRVESVKVDNEPALVTLGFAFGF
jgi:hypothetical protein